MTEAERQEGLRLAERAQAAYDACANDPDNIGLLGELATWIKRVAAPTMSASAVQGVIESLGLTGREAEVAGLLAGEGLSAKLIGSELGISAQTVKFHLQSIYRKLEVGGRSEAIIALRRAGILQRIPST